ncbi:MAG TPA: LysM peptidoglycan-binding domain-containing protein [Syntrophales bacterium]|nr:LysM peptidoglycan-binding domain-containing protein [Syntrophales bacterium]HRU88369.1 LysM peptidoglycan-binding domain-containing protein [Syntrophales bacterium]
MKNHLFLLIFFLILLLGGGGLQAREDTAYLSFRKSARVAAGTTVYTVKKGEWLLDIVRRVTGEKKNRLAIIRKYNPEIKDVNRIYPGQKIILPVKIKAASSPVPDQAKTSPPADVRKMALLTGAEVLPSRDKWSLIRHVLARIGATVTVKGKYYLPLNGLGHLNIDCQKIPLVEFADREMVFIDFTGQIPDHIRELVRQSWKNISVLKVDPHLTAPEILAAVIGVSGSHAMQRQTRPLKIGTPEVLQFHPDWTISPRTPLPGGTGYNIALWLRKEQAPALPETIKKYAATQGWEIIETASEKLLSPTPEKSYRPQPVPQLSSSSLPETAGDLFQRLNCTVSRNAPLKIFDSRRDGFDLIIKAEMLISRGEKKLVFFNRRLPNQFLEILKSDNTAVIVPGSGETRRSFLERSCRSLGIVHESGIFLLPLAATGDLSSVSLVLSGIKISPETGSSIYLIENDPGEALNGYLSQALGVLVIRY